MHYSETQYGTETRYAYGKLWESDPNNIIPSISFIMSMDESELFKDKLEERMQACGYLGKISDEINARQFLEACCKNAGVPLGSNTIKNWVRTGKVSQNADVRKNYYMLCFALNMTVDETEEFFFQAILQKPFNYKNLYETVCYFCLRNRLPYREVERLTYKIDNLPKQTTNSIIEVTMIVAGGVKSCRTETELIDYWTNYSSGFGVSKHTAYKEANDLIAECYDIAMELGAIKSRKANQLLGEIYGQYFRKMERGQKLFATSIKDSSLPDSITRNFIQGTQLSAISNGKATDDILRKAIILFGFYTFYAKAQLTDMNAEYFSGNNDLFDDFVYETNTRLDNCGYVGLYWRNPYDWMFGICAQNEDPLTALHTLIAKVHGEKYSNHKKRYLDKFT